MKPDNEEDCLHSLTEKGLRHSLLGKNRQAFLRFCSYIFHEMLLTFILNVIAFMLLSAYCLLSKHYFILHILLRVINEQLRLTAVLPVYFFPGKR